MGRKCTLSYVHDSYFVRLSFDRDLVVNPDIHGYYREHGNMLHVVLVP